MKKGDYLICKRDITYEKEIIFKKGELYEINKNSNFANQDYVEMKNKKGEKFVFFKEGTYPHGRFGKNFCTRNEDRKIKLDKLKKKKWRNIL